jgi:hypothetical protein
MQSVEMTWPMVSSGSRTNEQNNYRHSQNALARVTITYDKLPLAIVTDQILPIRTENGLHLHVLLGSTFKTPSLPFDQRRLVPVKSFKVSAISQRRMESMPCQTEN